MKDMEYQYKVTVIIPVYNAERYLADCLDSLLAQTIPQDQMEALMINDGSSDKSLEICERYAAAHKRFRVLSQKNQGVSAARNAGIRNARGKYLLYLDGDDTLSAETVKNVTDFFDRHYDEIDVVTYPLVYRRENGESGHWRYDYLGETGVYDLDEHPYICQTTINICVKNRKSNDKIYFDAGMTIHEDIAYNLAHCMPLNRIGYCKEAAYIYYQRATGTARRIAHPYYEGDNLLEIYEGFLAPYEGKKYPQSIVLYDIGWRIMADQLYPYHYSKERYENYQRRLARLLNKIDIELILSHPGVNDAHRYYLVSLRTENKPFYRFCRNHKTQADELLLFDQDGQIRRNDSVLVVVNRCKIERDSLYIMAYLKEFAFAFTKKPRLFAVIDEERRFEIPLFLSQNSCFWSEIRTNTFWGFSMEMELDSFSTLQFVVKLEDREFKTKYWFGDRQSIQPNKNRRYIQGERNTVLFQNDQFITLGNRDPDLLQAKKDYEKYLFKNKKKQWLVRRYAHKRAGRVIWLYEDTYNAVDNAYYQFLHDFEKNDGIERYYICDKANIDWKNLFTAKQRTRLVQRRGIKHKRLFIQADKILVSFIGQSDFVPFDRDTILYYWDLFHFEVIYLQHGVMHAELPNMYSKEKIYMIDKIVVSTHFERDNLIHRLAFREKDILNSGMSRLDALKREQRQRKILFAPSWRSYLVSTDSEGKRQAQSNFEKTNYYQEIRAFLTSGRLKDLLEKNEYRLEIKLHPNFQIYDKAFSALCGENITVVDTVKLGEYTAFFTDFSSFMYDCFYLDVPVITHIFDYERFKAGLHTYRGLCWPMEDEYANYCGDTGAVFAALERLIHHTDDFTEQFKKYTKEMFFNREPNHADQLYDRLIENAGEGLGVGK